MDGRERVLDTVVVHRTEAETRVRNHEAARRGRRRWAGVLALAIALLIVVWFVPGTGAGMLAWGGLSVVVAAAAALLMNAQRGLRQTEAALREALEGLLDARREAGAALEDGVVPDDDRPDLRAVLEKVEALIERQGVPPPSRGSSGPQREPGT